MGVSGSGGGGGGGVLRIRTLVHSWGPPLWRPSYNPNVTRRLGGIGPLGLQPSSMWIASKA